MSRCIAKFMYVEKPKRLIIWDGGSRGEILCSEYLFSSLCCIVSMLFLIDCVQTPFYAYLIPQLIRRPRPNYMETLQQDITMNMRGLLIDWLVEVSMDR